jgi:plasmid stability protein
LTALVGIAIKDSIDIIWSTVMSGAMTIRNIDDQLKRDLRRKAASNDRSMEEEARAALRSWVSSPSEADDEGLGTRLRKLFESTGGVELKLPPRGPARPLPDVFEE